MKQTNLGMPFAKHFKKIAEPWRKQQMGSAVDVTQCHIIQIHAVIGPRHRHRFKTDVALLGCPNRSFHLQTSHISGEIIVRKKIFTWQTESKYRTGSHKTAAPLSACNFPFLCKLIQNLSYRHAGNLVLIAQCILTRQTTAGRGIGNIVAQDLKQLVMKGSTQFLKRFLIFYDNKT